VPDQIRGDIRVAFTRSQLTAAMIELLQQKPAEEISVSELCKQADISRPTFYQYFKSPDDVLAAALEDKLEAIARAADAARPDRSTIPKVIARFLDALWHDRRLYRAALRTRSPYGYSRSVMEAWLQQALASYFRTSVPRAAPEDFDQRVLFAAGGIITAISRMLTTRGLTRPDFTALGASLWASVERVMAR
jgi:AcrR family transcriptional regulator